MSVDCPFLTISVQLTGGTTICNQLKEARRQLIDSRKRNSEKKSRKHWLEQHTHTNGVRPGSRTCGANKINRPNRFNLLSPSSFRQGFAPDTKLAPETSWKFTFFTDKSPVISISLFFFYCFYFSFALVVGLHFISHSMNRTHPSRPPNKNKKKQKKTD